VTEAKAGKAAATLKLRWIRSAICSPRDQKSAVRGLGFRRLGERIVREDSPSVRGMVRKVQHLVVVESEG
jgi:large subunit ribosomal protein L30